MPTYKFDMASKRISKDTSITAPEALFADLETDTLYVVDGTAIKAMHGGAAIAGTWRSCVVKAPSGVPTGFAWLRANGLMGPGLVVKLYADGALVHTTPSLTNGEPRRLPDTMARAWEIELTGAARVTSLVVTDNTEDLL
jgi:hypothetical protein